MRSSLLLPLMAVCLLAPVARAATPPMDKPAAPAAAVAIQPHRAIYDMSLESVKNGSTIAGVNGEMLFEWADACDGWAIQQNMHLHFDYAAGDTSEVSSNEVTWESKDGKRYNFNIRHVSDGKQTEVYRGKATLGGPDGDRVVYTTPDNKVEKFQAETVFPSAHTALIIKKAEAGERFFTRRVFDGTDAEGSDDVSAFIGAPIAKPITAGAGDSLDANPLLAATAWPVHLAFFKIGDDSSVPDYEMDLQLLANGVARSMRIDYGDFTVNGTLKAIEALPPPHC